MSDALEEGLGELEQLVLLATLRLRDKAYGVTIIQQLGAVTPRSVSRPSVYLALTRLTKKGLLSARLGDPTPQRGGRAKRFYQLTPRGLAVLRATRRAYLSLSKGLEPVLDRGSVG
jgi:DNA-binding PadR family transcriptional regulator